MAIFDYKDISDDPSLMEILFSGEIRSGSDLSADSFDKFLNKCISDSSTKIIVFDISEISYWDTEGMRKLLKTIEKINEKNDGRGVVVGNMETVLYRRATEKYKINDGLIPWVKNKDEFIPTE